MWVLDLVGGYVLGSYNKAKTEILVIAQNLAFHMLKVQVQMS